MTEIINKENLENILKKGSDGKPILELTPLEKTAVHTPTQEIYNELMRVYEIGNWKWFDEKLPTKFTYWNEYKRKTCIDAGVTHYSKLESQFGYSDKKFCLKNNFKVLSTQNFYEIQKITPKMIKEINEYFEGRK